LFEGSLADLDPRVLHDLAPVRELRLDVRAELAGRAACCASSTHWSGPAWSRGAWPTAAIG
jgi:hypothetical protein